MKFPAILPRSNKIDFEPRIFREKAIEEFLVYTGWVNIERVPVIGRIHDDSDLLTKKKDLLFQVVMVSHGAYDNCMRRLPHIIWPCRIESTSCKKTHRAIMFDKKPKETYKGRWPQFLVEEYCDCFHHSGEDREAKVLFYAWH